MRPMERDMQTFPMSLNDNPCACSLLCYSCLVMIYGLWIRDISYAMTFDLGAEIERIEP